MSHDLTLSHLIAQLTLLGNWETAHGPRHPTEPDPHLVPEIEQFWASYPFLRGDPGYVDFLEQYAGARLWDTEAALGLELPNRPYHVEAQNLDLFGFSHTVSTHLIADDEDNLPIIDADGFLQVAILNVTMYKLDATLPGDTMHFADKAIAFDATGKRPGGVYAKTSGPADSEPITHWSMPSYQWCWPSFLDFLVACINGEVLAGK